MKYIDAEKLSAEIERQMKFYDEKEMKAWDDSEQGDEDALWYQGHRKMCVKLLAIITSLQQEQPEVDLEKEIKNYLATKCAGDDEPSVSEIARHFYELGLNARKEE